MVTPTMSTSACRPRGSAETAGHPHRNRQRHGARRLGPPVPVGLVRRAARTARRSQERSSVRSTIGVADHDVKRASPATMATAMRGRRIRQILDADILVLEPRPGSVSRRRSRPPRRLLPPPATLRTLQRYLTVCGNRRRRAPRTEGADDENDDAQERIGRGGGRAHAAPRRHDRGRGVRAGRDRGGWWSCTG